MASDRRSLLDSSGTSWYADLTLTYPKKRSCECIYSYQQISLFRQVTIAMQDKLS